MTTIRTTSFESIWTLFGKEFIQCNGIRHDCHMVTGCPFPLAGQKMGRSSALNTEDVLNMGTAWFRFQVPSLNQNGARLLFREAGLRVGAAAMRQDDKKDEWDQMNPWNDEDYHQEWDEFTSVWFEPCCVLPGVCVRRVVQGVQLCPSCTYSGDA